MSLTRLITLLVVLALSGCSTALSVPTGTVPSGDAGKPPSNCHARGTGLFALPDPRCSPGATNPNVNQGNIDQTICRRGWTKTIRPPVSVTGPEKRIEMRAYGVTGSHGYELDHIVSLELGGAPNLYKNYFPERNYPGAHGFELNPKDKLENVLKHRICDGKISLVAAQKAISTDWAKAYSEFVK